MPVMVTRRAARGRPPTHRLGVTMAMAGRRTNLGLLAALLVAAVTGVGAFVVGTATGRAVVIAHGAAGLAVVVLTPWKQQIVRRGLRRPRMGRAAALGLLALVALTVASGLAHAVGVDAVAGVTAMQVHVGAAIGLILPLAWHVVTRTVRPRRTDLGRRTILRSSALAAAAGGAWLAAEGAYALAGVAPRRFTGSHERGTDDPARMPVTQWMFDRVPVLDPAAWRLALTDSAGTRTLTLADLRRLPAHGRRVTLDCTGGWYATQTWRGVALGDLVTPASGRRIVVASATGYTRALPIAMLGDLLLALDVAGRPLSPGHGAPARLVAPDRRGFWWVKWVTAITVDDGPAWAQPPFPLQ